ncbi:alpha/beta fold hydrolase [Nocardioides sp. SR21]|uniref:alpha/beta fold hydrolase n=1 Tax=Nocardioides sp. SR21 TaxID=2919501 RepID=UPI001FAB274E|nr:alpha/beta hydrolase [Nocardioides sp. SR21]
MTRQLVPGPERRTIEVLVEGALDGPVVLFHGGTPSAVAEFPMLDDAARAHGLRVVTYSRPGYGRSTPRPAPGAFADDVADAVAVLDHLGIDDFLTLGWSGGGPRALGCAALLPARCRAATTISGVAPFDADGLDWYDGMAEENHEEYGAAQAGPEAYDAYLVEHVLPMLSTSADELEEAFGGLVTPVDAAVLTADFARWMSHSFNHAATQGAVGIRDDGLAAMQPWGFELAGIRVPVALWHGREDAFVPYTHGVWLAERIPGVETHLFEDEGHLTLMYRLDEVLADLKRLGGY